MCVYVKASQLPQFSGWIFVQRKWKDGSVKRRRSIDVLLCFKVISFMDVDLCLVVVCNVKVIHVQK